MPTATGQAKMGSAMPLCYGRVCATGMRTQDYTVPRVAWQPSTNYQAGDQTTDPKSLYLFTCVVAGTSGSSQPAWNSSFGSTTNDGSVRWRNDNYLSAGKTYGFWLLGDGEWDGPDILWNQGTVPVQPFLINVWPWGPNPPEFHFHSGADTPTGTVIIPTSTGGDQLCDAFFDAIPSSTPRLCYSGIAYYALGWQPQNWQGQSANLQPVGHWRTMKCRIFDDVGNQVDYKFTTNPAWHWVDAWLRRAIFPRSEYTITASGPTALPSYAKDKFDWGSVYEFAQDCDYLLSGGQKRFEGNYAFAGQTTLAAILETILLCSRGYQQEAAGKLYVYMDKPRASVFTLTSKHLVPGTFSVDDKSVHQAANDYTSNFLDLDLPAVSTIDSISLAAFADEDGHDEATVVTVDENPVAQWDTLWIGGNSNPVLNRPYYVRKIIDNHTWKGAPLVGIGSDQSGVGGVLGYPQSKFSKRSAQLLHKQHAIARGFLFGDAGSGSRTPSNIVINLNHSGVDLVTLDGHNGQDIWLYCVENFSDGSQADVGGTAAWSVGGSGATLGTNDGTRQKVSLSNTTSGSLTATVTATFGAFTATLTITVYNITSLVLNQDGGTSNLGLLHAADGDVFYLYCVGLAGDGSHVDLSSSVTWSVSGSGIALGAAPPPTQEVDCANDTGRDKVGIVHASYVGGLTVALTIVVSGTGGL